MPKQRDKPEKKYKRINWTKIEIEYKTTPISLRKLAEKYKISINTLLDHACRKGNKWGKDKQIVQQEITVRTHQKTLERLISKKAEQNALHFEISQNFMNVLKEVSEDPKQFYKHIAKLRTGYGIGEFKDELITEELDAINSKALLDVMNAFEKNVELQRKLLRVVDEKDRLAYELGKERLDVEKSKANIGDDDDNETGIVLMPQRLPANKPPGGDIVEPLSDTEGKDNNAT